MKRSLKDVYRRHHSDARLLKPTRLISPRTKRLNDFKGLHNAGQQRNGIIFPPNYNRPKSTSSLSKKTSLERNFPVPCVYKDRHSTCLLTRPTGRKRSAGKSTEKITELAKDVRNSKPREIDVTGGLAVKEHRSYAQMIADYSETVYVRSGFGVAKDGASLIMFNGIHRSPFSTASAVTPKWKSKDRATKKASFRATGSGAVQQEAKFSSGTFVSRYDCRNDHRNIMQAFGNNTDLERASSSYATMIEKYSHTTNVSVDPSGCGNTAVPRRNVSTKFSHASMAFLDTKDNDRPPQAPPGNAGIVSKDLSKEQASNVDKQEPVGWITKMEDVIKDLKRITAKKDEAQARANEKLVLQSVHERAHWLDRVVTAHKKRIRDKKPISGNAMVQEKVNESIEAKENTWGNDTVLAAPKGDHDPITQAPKMAVRNKPTDPISQYIKPRPVGSNTPTKSSSQTPTAATTAPVKEPQIELRMTPSQNESVVSINVDEQATKTAGTRDQLSVVISSKRNETGKVDANNLKSDFGSMQISISESTVPVKQIEFSINGKPVSELKSIVARADKLDVVSSMDKVEIRIPPSQIKAASQQTQNLAATSSRPVPVLNLQIAAKFNEPRIQKPTDTGVRTSPTTNPVIPIPQKPKTHFTPKPPFSEANNADVTSVRTDEDVAGTQQVNPVPAVDARASISRQETDPNVAESSPSTVKGNDAFIHTHSNTNVPPTSPTRQPPVNIGNTNPNKSPEDRAPSNVIPWWTSEDSFKIKKTKNTPKDASAPVEGGTSTTETRESVNLTKTTAPDQQLSSVNPSKTVSPVLPGKDTAAKKPVSDEKQKSDAADSTHRVVRVRSPQKRATVKSASGVKTSKHVKRNSASSIGRIGKKVKYRPKSNLAKTVAAAKKEPDTLTSSTPRSPKAVKYVSVTPQRANISEKPETPEASPPRTEVTEQPIIAWKVEGSKAEQESKTTANVPKPAGPEKYIAPVGKANVQNSKTIHKDTGLEKPANRSAGVSAESSLQFAKGREQDKTNGAIEKKLSRGSETVDEVSNQRLKEILKSMKPIEKREDGTLIDYGVTVPSRKPSGKLRQPTVIPTKTPITIDPKKVIAVPPTKLKDTPSEGKIVEPEKISSVKKETLTEPKNLPNPVKIVDAEKVSSTKKSVEAKTWKTSREPSKINTPEPKVQPKKPLTNEPPKNSLNSGEDNTKQLSTSISSDKKKNGPVEVTATPSQPQLPKNPPKAPLEGTIVRSARVTDKKAASADRLPLEGTVPVSPQKTGVQVAKDDNTFLKGPAVRLEKRLSNTGSAPFKGTIDYRPRNQDSLSTVISINEKSGRNVGETQSEVLPKSTVTETPVDEDRDSAKSGGTVGIPTGPAGLKPASSFAMTKVLSNDKIPDKIKSDEGTPFNEGPETCVLFSSDTMRPEKDMLYSSWLQRFKGKLDDDGVV